MSTTSIHNWHLNKGDEVAIASHLDCAQQGDSLGIVDHVSGDSVFVRMTKSSLLRKFSVKHVRKALPPLQGPIFRQCLGHCDNCGEQVDCDWEIIISEKIFRTLPHITNADLFEGCLNEGTCCA